MSKCYCETKEHIQIGYQVIGYGRSTQTVIDFENAEIKHYYSHACDQNTVDIMKILFCPFCGKKIERRCGMKLNEQTKKDIDRAFKALDALEEIKNEIKDLHNSHMINFVSADDVVDTCIEIIDKHIGKES